MTTKLNKSGIDIGASENPALAAFEAWMAFNRPMMTALSDINDKIFQQAATANSEWLNFLSRRLNEEISLSKRFMECKTLQDVIALYAEFYQRAQKQYQDEFQYFARLNQKMADETASMVRTHFEAASSEFRH